MALIPLLATPYAFGLLSTAVAQAVIMGGLSNIVCPLEPFSEPEFCSLDGMEFQGELFSEKKSVVQETASKVVSTFQEVASKALTSVCQKARHLLVVARSYGGKGDISGAVKIWKYLNFSRPCDTVQVAIQEKDREKAALFGDLVKKYTIVLNYKKPDMRPDLAVDYPFNVAEELRQNFLFDAKIPQIGIREYGFGSEPVLKATSPTLKIVSLGAGDNELGIMIDKELAAFYSDPQNAVSLRRLSLLADVPEALSQAILGEPFSQNALQSFDTSTKLYFGYSQLPASKEAFVEIMAQISSLANENAQSLCFVFAGLELSVITGISMNLIMGIDATQKEVQETFALMGDSGKLDFTKWDFFKRIGKLGFNEVELIWSPSKYTNSFTSKVVPVNEVKIPHQVRSIRIICKDSFDNSVFLTLLKASEKETLVTGDQSPTEALSLGKIIVNEYLPHKMSFMRDLAMVARKVSEAFTKPLALLFGGLNISQTEHYSSPTWREFSASKIGHITQALQTVRKQESLWQGFIQKVHDSYNCFPKIANLVQEGLEILTL